MRLKHLDLVVAIAIALGNLLWSTFSNHHPQIIGIFLALPQVFLLPGYTLIELLFHRHPMENVRRFVLSLSVSIAIVIISGFILQKSAWGITTLSWAVYLSSMTVIFSLAAMFLRTGHRITLINRTTLAQPYSIFRKHPVSITCMLIAIGLAIVSIAYSSYSVVNEKRPGFTQLWIVPTNPDAKSCAVLIGVDSFEFTTTKYHVFVTTKGALTSTWSSPIILSPEKTWKVVRPVGLKDPGDVEIMVQLYEDKKPGVLYRYVHLFMHGQKNKATQALQCTTP
jgi:uncharacterized membrane protein